MDEERGHLVLMRKVGETILIGKDVQITVTDVSGGKVRIGIIAPKTMQILRKELLRDGQELHN